MVLAGSYGQSPTDGGSAASGLITPSCAGVRPRMRRRGSIFGKLSTGGWERLLRKSTPHGHMPSAGQEGQCTNCRSFLFLGEKGTANSISLEHMALHVLG